MATVNAKTNGRIEQLNVSPGGVPKRAVPEAIVNEYGLTQDRQRDRRHHGGAERAVCLFSAEILDSLRADGHQIGPGTTGENVTIRGIDWKKLVPGSRVHLGEQVIVEITSYAAPCRIIAQSFRDGDFNRINQATHPGRSRLYARVVRQGDDVPGRRRHDRGRLGRRPRRSATAQDHPLASAVKLISSPRIRRAVAINGAGAVVLCAHANASVR